MSQAQQNEIPICPLKTILSLNVKVLFLYFNNQNAYFPLIDKSSFYILITKLLLLQFMKMLCHSSFSFSSSFSIFTRFARCDYGGRGGMRPSRLRGTRSSPVRMSFPPYLWTGGYNSSKSHQKSPYIHIFLPILVKFCPK